MSPLIPLSFHKILQTRSYTAIILGTAEKKFVIYTTPEFGHTLELQLHPEQLKRPTTFTLLDQALKGLNVNILRVIIDDIQESTYFAKLVIEQTHPHRRHVIKIDARPSDSVLLALIQKVPLFCTEKVLAQSITIEEDTL